jgi:hypothetical protein
MATTITYYHVSPADARLCTITDDGTVSVTLGSIHMLGTRAAVRSTLQWALDAIDADLVHAEIIESPNYPAGLPEAIKELGQWAEGGYPTPDYLTDNHRAYQLGLGTEIARRIVGITEAAQ